MSKWPTKPIGELCQLINGRAFKPTDWGTEGLRIIRIQNLNDHDKPFNFYNGEYRDAHYIDDGEILLSWSGTPGTSFGCFRWTRGPGLLNQHIFRVLTNESEIDGDFFILAVNSKLDEMIGLAHGGVGLRHITKGKLEAIRLPLPSLEEQGRLVGRIEECLGRVQEISTITDEQFAAQQFILRSARRELFGAPSALPSHWTEHRLDELASVIYGISEAISNNKDPALGPPIVRMANISVEGDLDLSDLRYCPIPKGKEDHFLLKSGDLLLNWRSGSASHIGKTAIFEGEGRFTCASFILRIRAYPGKANNRYLRHLLNFMRAEGVFTGSSRMQINHKLNAAEFSAFQVRIPPSLEIQEAIADKLDAVEALSRQCRFEILEKKSQAVELREAILRKAFAGEL